MPVAGTPYPINLLLTGRRVLVVGGGSVARGKVRGLLDAGADVTVVAPDISDDLRALPVRIEQRAYRRGEVGDYRLAIAATDRAETNRAVFDDGEAAGVWVNAVDDPTHCSAILPARLRRGNLLVTVSTGGHSPAVSSWLRQRLEQELGPEYGVLVDLLAEARAEAREQGRSTEGIDWRSALDSGMLDLIRDGRSAEARARLDTVLGKPE